MVRFGQSCRRPEAGSVIDGGGRRPLKSAKWRWRLTLGLAPLRLTVAPNDRCDQRRRLWPVLDIDGSRASGTAPSVPSPKGSPSCTQLQVRPTALHKAHSVRQLTVRVGEQPHVVDRGVHIGDGLLHHVLVPNDLSGPFCDQEDPISRRAKLEVNHSQHVYLFV